jgi:hypothetical protein
VHDSVNISRQFRRVAAGAAAGALLFALPGCGDKTSEFSTPCAIVVDGSLSSGVFDASKRLDETGTKFLVEQKCGHVSFVPLNGNSESTTCEQDRLAMDPGVGNPDTAMDGRRKLAVKRAHDLLDCTRTSRNRASDVLGALRLALRNKPEGSGAYRILLVSDMVLHDEHVDLNTADLSTAAKRADVIKKLAPVTPGLKGAELFPTDLGKGTAGSTRSKFISDFWHELLSSAAAGGPTLDESYGA